MRRKSWDNVRRASSAIAPAISTPVGPAPTTVKVKAVRRSSSELESQQLRKHSKCIAASSKFFNQARTLPIPHRQNKNAVPLPRQLSIIVVRVGQVIGRVDLL